MENMTQNRSLGGPEERRPNRQQLDPDQKEMRGPGNLKQATSATQQNQGGQMFPGSMYGSSADSGTEEDNINRWMDQYDPKPGGGADGSREDLLRPNRGGGNNPIESSGGDDDDRTTSNRAPDEYQPNSQTLSYIADGVGNLRNLKHELNAMRQAGYYPEYDGRYYNIAQAAWRFAHSVPDGVSERDRSMGAFLRVLDAQGNTLMAALMRNMTPTFMSRSIDDMKMILKGHQDWLIAYNNNSP
jgi:hypothetical protein